MGRLVGSETGCSGFLHFGEATSNRVHLKKCVPCAAAAAAGAASQCVQCGPRHVFAPGWLAGMSEAAYLREVRSHGV